MSASKKNTGSDFAKVDAYVNSAADYEEIPELTDEQLDHAVLHENCKPLRGRPPVGEKPKTSVTIRLDHDIVEHYRGLGAGWQSKMNAALRKTLGAV